jgi:hypothetical protein
MHSSIAYIETLETEKDVLERLLKWFVVIFDVVFGMQSKVQLSRFSS